MFVPVAAAVVHAASAASVSTNTTEPLKIPKYVGQSQSPDSSNSLAVGIGVGVSLGVLSMGFVIFFVIWRMYRKKSKAQLTSQYYRYSGSPSEFTMNEIVQSSSIPSFRLKEIEQSPRKQDISDSSQSVQTTPMKPSRPVIEIPEADVSEVSFERPVSFSKKHLFFKV